MEDFDMPKLQSDNADSQKFEDVKNRCLILLAVDRFSDFLADKSNIINRALASEILVNVFELNPNLTENFFIFEHLLGKDIQSGWEPKQAIFFLLTQILNSQKDTFLHNQKKLRYEKKKSRKKVNHSKNKKNKNLRDHKISKNYLIVSENLGQIASLQNEQETKKKLFKKIKNKKYKNLENLKLLEQDLEFETIFREKQAKFLKGPVINESNLGMILPKVTEVLTQHEEIAETCCEFLLSVLGAPFFTVPESYWLGVQEKLNEALILSEDISYLPKSAFEFLTELLKRGFALNKVLKNHLDEHLNKFMFHDNPEVRGEVYVFVSQLFTKSDSFSSQVLSSDKTKHFFSTFFFYASLSHASFSDLANEKFFPLVSLQLLSQKKSTQVFTNELEEICSILYKMLSSTEAIQAEILEIILSSLDIINLKDLYAKIKCTFKYNLENYTTEADPQKMIYIAYNILRRFEFAELQRVLGLAFNSDSFATSSSPLKTNICVLTLLGMLDLYHKLPGFLTEVDFTKFKNQVVIGSQNKLLGFDFANLLETPKGNLTMAFIQKETEGLESDIKVFFSSHFGTGKILAPSKKTQEMIMKILFFLKENSFHSNLETVFNFFIELENNLRREIQEGASPLVKTNVVLKTMEDSILYPLKKLIDIFSFLLNLVKAIGSIQTQLGLIASSKLPSKSKINSLVKPFLFLLERPLVPCLSKMCSKGLFLFNLVYVNEKKHPNFKIVSSLVKNCMLKGPETNKVCYFFPTPKSDSLSFGKTCSMRPCFLKNKSTTMGFQEVSKKIKAVPYSMRGK